MSDIIPIDAIQSKIYLIRGQRVMLDRDLSSLYGVETRMLNQTVKRNINRFPPHFMFQLSTEEFMFWKSQIVISKGDKKGLRKFPFAFTEHGILMLSSVLNSDKAIKINIKIIDVFIQLRKSLLNADSLKLILNSLTDRVDKHDAQIQNIINAVNTLIAENMKLKPVISKNKKPMGFDTSAKSGKPD
ncbi:MAG TPA: ORF6N domain-containing protein [bacterium]|nr:ORF6N domain-containing protein [bacterium]HPN31356.1 ORF6N domain-containing protein [bacterium]